MKSLKFLKKMPTVNEAIDIALSVEEKDISSRDLYTVQFNVLNVLISMEGIEEARERIARVLAAPIPIPVDKPPIYVIDYFYGKTTKLSYDAVNLMAKADIDWDKLTGVEEISKSHYERFVKDYKLTIDKAIQSGDHVDPEGTVTIINSLEDLKFYIYNALIVNQKYSGNLYRKESDVPF